ncbi:hypothetical protein HYX13_02800 [Candidatus Woesearchaeota archaeon]|nr:hypothetical protein [Candidatus Woesearchaeota archaeon]
MSQPDPALAGSGKSAAGSAPYQPTLPKHLYPFSSFSLRKAERFNLRDMNACLSAFLASQKLAFSEFLMTNKKRHS